MLALHISTHVGSIHGVISVRSFCGNCSNHSLGYHANEEGQLYFVLCNSETNILGWKWHGHGKFVISA